MIPPSAQLTLTKGNKSGSSPAEAAALELVGSPWLWTLAVTHCGRFFFFFFFFLFLLILLPNYKVPATQARPSKLNAHRGQPPKTEGHCTPHGLISRRRIP
eukprot:FR744173.1.p3 GENE.FR744173.1~~FR744173.1.p3  ORF type:complete len:101 (-),score=20.93 FR744173.1:427-729(-)